MNYITCIDSVSVMVIYVMLCQMYDFSLAFRHSILITTIFNLFVLDQEMFDDIDLQYIYADSE